MLLLLLAGFGPACDTGPVRTAPPEPTMAALEVTITPNPLRLLIVCPSGNPYCFASLDSIVTIRETAGVGGRLNAITLVLQNTTLNRPESTVNLDSNWIVQNAGTNRLEPRASLALRPVVEGYPLLQGTSRPDFAIVLNVQLTDDRGNVVQAGATVPIV